MKALRFKPLIKPTIWGGEHILELKGITEGPKQIGESWEISAVPGAETPVAEGLLKGKILPELIEQFKEELLGKRNFTHYGTNFPLLVKFIDSAGDLSIQVHPDETIARRMGHPFGKTEMWYLVNPVPGASLYAGFRTNFSARSYVQSLKDGTLTNHLARHESHPGDCFFIPAGCIHSISAGNFLIEIQQSSDDTFRVYDFDRTDAQGNKRELHVEQAREALNYLADPYSRVNYTAADDTAVDLVDCAKFTSRLYRLTADFEADYSLIDSFVIFVAYKGEAELTYDEGIERLREGETILFPATTQHIRIHPLTPRFEMLETYVKG